MKKYALLLVITAMFLFCSCGVVAIPVETPIKPIEEKTVSEKVMIYFASADSMYLIPEEREITYKTDDEFVMKIIDALIEGPVSQNLYPVLSKDSAVKKVEVKERVYEITLDESFVSLNTGGSTKEFMALYSITNTLCELEFADSVRFLNADGSLLEEFGSYAIDLPLTKDTSISD